MEVVVGEVRSELIQVGMMVPSLRTAQMLDSANSTGYGGGRKAENPPKSVTEFPRSVGGDPGGVGADAPMTAAAY